MTVNETHGVAASGKRLALVLGITGNIGRAVAEELLVNGYRVRAMHREAAAKSLVAPQYDWVSGDAMSHDDVMRAADGADLIVHAVNPPGYRNWGTLVLPMIDNTIASAEATGALILVPGNIYNFGPEAFDNISEDSPQNPQTVKGRIRVVMEQRLEAAAGRGARVIIVRAGDFFGPGAGSNWLAQAVIKPGRPVSAITNPAGSGIGHQWAYLPDVAETMLQLVARADELPAFSRFHMEGFWDHDGMQMAQAIRRVCGRPDLPVKRFPWWLVWLGSPFVPVFRELLEMRYLWQRAVQMRNGKLVDFLGKEPQTPIDEAMRQTLRSLGCLEPGAGSGRYVSGPSQLTTG